MAISRYDLNAQKHAVYKIAVFSDSHQHDERFLKALKVALKRGPIDAFIHLGDCVEDCEVIRKNMAEIPVISVKGNNDFGDVQAPNEALLQIGDITIYCTHGHRYPACGNAAIIAERAGFFRADVACFGHTHRALLEKIDDVIVINPGSVAFPRDSNNASFAIINLPQGKKLELGAVEIIRVMK